MKGLFMVCNMGKTDRVLRAVIGAVVLGVGYYYNSYWGFVGLVPILTAAVGFCPAYLPFNLSTAKNERVSQSKRS